MVVITGYYGNLANPIDLVGLVYIHMSSEYYYLIYVLYVCVSYFVYSTVAANKKVFSLTKFFLLCECLYGVGGV